jgi:hypothetical protein
VKPCSLHAVISLEIMSGSVMLDPMISMAGVSGGQSNLTVSCNNEPHTTLNSKSNSKMMYCAFLSCNRRVVCLHECRLTQRRGYVSSNLSMTSEIVKLLELDAIIVFGLASSSSCLITVRFSCRFSDTFYHSRTLSATIFSRRL